jgi:regulatory protein
LKSNAAIRLQALKLLARREHSCQELRRKLQKRGRDADEVEIILQQLAAEKLLSDERFSESFIRQRREAGFGPRRIRAELSERGVHLEKEEHFQSSDLWEDQLEKIWQKKFKGDLPRDLKAKAKQNRFLLNRGFTLDHIHNFWRKKIL